MTAVIERTNCCGFKEIDGLENTTTKQALIDICHDYFNEDNDCAFLFFTGVTKEKYGQKFKALIKKEKLGTIIETRSKKNPNSSNKIKAWIWDINKTKLRAFAKQNKVEIVEINPW